MSELTATRRFGPTSGVVTGVVGLVCCAGVAAIALTGEVDTASVRVALVAAFVAVLIWAYMLRPRIVLEADGATLLLRNPLSEWRVALAGVKVVGVKTITTVKTEDQRFDCVAVGYPIRKIARGQVLNDGRPGALPSTRPTDQPIQDFMADQILAAADRARELGLPDEPPRRTPAYAEIAALVLLVVAFLATFVA